MKKKITLLLVFITTFLSFSFSAKADGETVCEYNDSTNNCTIKVRSLRGAGTRFEFFKANKTCEGYTLTFRNSESDFLTTFQSKFSEKNICPKLYLEKKAGNKMLLTYSSSSDSAKEIKPDCTGQGCISEGVNKTEYSDDIDMIQEITVGEKYQNCNQLLSDKLVEKLDAIFLVIKIATPLLLIIVTMIDFMKAITSGDSNEVTKCVKTFVKRGIIAICIFLVPTICEFVMDISGISDGVCGIG